MAKSNTYEEFVEKFKPKKTTDDCYTPEPVYNTIADWVANEYGLDRANFVRPFYPGGDYRNYDYKKMDVVVDNPPFSILAEIKDWYAARGIKFFLFAPALTLFNKIRDYPICYIAANAQIIYENGAKVNTSFVTNLEPPERLIRTAPDLKNAVKNAVKEYELSKTKKLPKYQYPDEVLTATRLYKLKTEFIVNRDDAHFIRSLESQRPAKKALFGGGFLLSELKSAELKHVWGLSEAEKEIVESLGKE